MNAPMSMPMVDEEALRKVEALQQRYIAALDSNDLESWASCFATHEAASYICISAENASRGLEIALMLDDCRARILDRVTIVTKVWAGTFQDYRTRHFTQRTGPLGRNGDEWLLRSNFTIAITPEGGGSSLLAVGQYEDRIVFEEGEARFISKRAVYDTTVLPRYIVYPL